MVPLLSEILSLRKLLNILDKEDNNINNPEWKSAWAAHEAEETGKPDSTLCPGLNLEQKKDISGKRDEIQIRSALWSIIIIINELSNVNSFILAKRTIVMQNSNIGGNWVRSLQEHCTILVTFL